MRKLAFAGMVILTALTIQPGPARAAEETVNTWPQALPPGVRTPLDLGTLSGYWARGYMPGRGFLYISPQGLLDATIWKDGDVSAFIGRWKPVQEIAFNASAEGREVLMATDEKYCSTDGTREEDRLFRLLDTYKRGGGMSIGIDYAIGISPPENPLAVDNEALWSLFQKNAKTTYKDEGARVRIDEADVPLWFRNLVAQTILVGNWGCDWR